MRRLLCILTIAFGASLFGAAGAFATPIELITNGDFEAGNLSGWTASQTLSSTSCDWQVNNCAFDSPAADGGSYDASNAFDGGGPGAYSLTQTVTIPAGTATLSWEDNIFTDYFGTNRTVEVRILNASGTSTLATAYSFTVPQRPFYFTGWVQHSVDVSAFAGQTVQIDFVQTVPQSYTGPGGFGLDNVQLLATPAPTPPAPPAPPAPSDSPRAGYCAVAGNTWADGTPIMPGTFVNLGDGQASSDPHFVGATPAIFVSGKGITCDPPPKGFTHQGWATSAMQVDDDLYPYYAP